MPIVEGAGGVVTDWDGGRATKAATSSRAATPRSRRRCARCSRALMQAFLVLGGTRFLGRHLVDAAVERGHTVTTFTRGQSPTHEHPAVLPLGGDRDPGAGTGLAALRSGTWDAVFDTSGYVPRIVGASCDLLASRVRRYLFVSSLSVYTDTSAPGVTEDAPRARSTTRRPRTSRSTTAR